MELVYLWVKEYKNIHKQGFNFSPQFNCKFHDEYDENEKLKDNCKLEIKENDDYIENFFGENINVTAIVGKNGSGKSTILECLQSIFLNIREFNYILVFNDGENYYKSNIEINPDISNKDTTEIQCHIYSNDIKEYKNSISIKKENILQYLLSSSLQKNFQLTTFMYVPTLLEIRSIDLDEYFRKTIEYDYTDYRYDNDITDDENRRVMYAQEDMRSQLTEIDNDYHKFLIILFIREKDTDAFDYIDGLSNQTTLLAEMRESEIDYLSEDEFNEYINDEDKEKPISELTEKEKSIYLNYYYFFEFDFIDSKDRGYNNLSHGERTIFGQFLSIYNLSIQQYRSYHLFLLDEAELSLHPNWQKDYLNELINLLKQIDKKFHFILTSHSPFLLSDLPKQNTFFLDIYEDKNNKSKEKYPNLNFEDLKNGNCLNVSNEIDIKPFGANIHELLSHGFFMEDGLMGEFAKGKINEIIKNLNKKTYRPNKKDKKRVLLIIESIGEDLLRMKLLDMYYEKFENDELEREKKQLLEQQKEILERIKSIEDKQK